MKQTKQDLRKQMLARREALSPGIKKDLDELLSDRVEEYAVKNKCTTIHTYLPMGSEINLFPLIEKWLSQGKTIVTPRSLPGKKMQHLQLSSLSELEPGIFGTTYPAGNVEYKGNYDLIIVPGLAFDEDFYRVGYGAGYYDIFLASVPHVIKLAVCYPFQMITQVPRESHDIPIDEIFY